MKETYCDITILLDRSGSMGVIRGPMQKALRAFVREHKKVDKPAKLTLVQFDAPGYTINRTPAESLDWYSYSILNQNILDVDENKIELIPRGGTAYYDSLCRCIDETGQRFASMPEASRPSQVLFVTITDGEENSSIRYNLEDCKSRVKHQSEVYKWNFVFTGANLDAKVEAAKYGYSPGNVLEFAHNTSGVECLSTMLIGNSKIYRSCATPGLVDDFFSLSENNKEV